MENLKNQYDNISNERQQIIKELEELSQSEVLKRYFELTKRDDKLLLEQKKVVAEIRNHEYECCDHVLVMTSKDYDTYEGRSQKYYGCIKCGLTDEVYRKIGYGVDLLNFEEKIMYNFLKDRYLRGKNLNVLCDLDLARSIYNKIKEKNPDEDEETLCKYFEIALENEKKEIKVKRLNF